MGQYAQDRLNYERKNGITTPKIKPITRVCCELCGKEVNGKAALMQHENSKHYPKGHPNRHSFYDIEGVYRNERFY